MSDKTPPDEDDQLWDELGEFASDAEDDSDAETDADSEATETIVDAEVIDTRTPTEPAELVDESDRERIASDEHTANTPVESPQMSDGVDTSADAAETPEVDEAFDQMDVSQVDGEALWDELAGFGTDEAAVSEPREPSTDSTVETGQHSEMSTPGEPVGQADHDTAPADPTAAETVVDKRQYCQQCPHFSKPPEVACQHEGTSIVEVLIDGQFRLRGCPVVTDSGPDRTLLNDGS